MQKPTDSIILVVESNDTEKDLICDMIQERGYKRFICASSADEAIEFLGAGRKPDIVLLGNVQDMDSINLVKEIKIINSEVIVIFLSTNDDLISPFKAMEKGCDCWVDRQGVDVKNKLIENIEHWSYYKIAKNNLHDLYSNRRQ